MSNTSLKAFLQPMQMQNKEVIISERFKDEEGHVVPFIIRPILSDEAQSMMKKNIKTKKNGEQEFDNTNYQADMIASSIISPDLKDSDLQKFYGVFGEREVLLKMLLIGEYTTLRTAVFELSGLFDDINKKIEDAKN